MSYAVTVPDREFQALRRLLAKVPRGRGRRYPAAVFARGWEEVAYELSIHPQTLQRWVGDAAAGARGGTTPDYLEP